MKMTTELAIKTIVKKRYSYATNAAVKRNDAWKEDIMQTKHKETKKVTISMYEITCDVCEETIPTNRNYVCSGCGVDLCRACSTCHLVDGFRSNDGTLDYFCKYCLRILKNHEKRYEAEHKQMDEEYQKHRQSLDVISHSFREKAEKAYKKRQKESTKCRSTGKKQNK